jgi:hypothetical protein
MFSFLRNLLNPTLSSFVINEVDHVRNVVILEDMQLSLRVEIPIGEKTLKEAKIIEPYAILLTYEDGSQQKKKILK